MSRKLSTSAGREERLSEVTRALPGGYKGIGRIAEWRQSAQRDLRKALYRAAALNECPEKRMWIIRAEGLVRKMRSVGVATTLGD